MVITRQMLLMKNQYKWVSAQPSSKVRQGKNKMLFIYEL